MQPLYINLLKSGDFSKRVGDAYGALRDCKLCPHNCGVDRIKNKNGICKTGKVCKVASANLHFGEEPPISGTKGSGTIFFSNCNLRCIFCQNYPISQLGNGKEAPPNVLANMMLNLQKQGAHNINLVTPSHVVPQFLAGLFIAAKNGLNIPIVDNCSGYDGLESLKLLDGVVDIYMPDIKYFDDKTAKKYSSADNYWEAVQISLKEMYRQVGPLEIDENGIGIKGMLIRHLVLPQGLASSEKLFKFIANEFSEDVPVNLMSQFFPAHKAGDDPIINRRITREEFKKAEKALYKYNLTKGWIQPMGDD
ncbi:MAG: radical SAM protein [Deltaproteobacteria bacterium CG07_land_8_20_14_0_80_38_7]|nr:MAG: radical SAM protein [Deltaproteobacteria bacterium CG07_land_8_20_14_0_80_38_7]